jgi:hypothetical protein
MKFKMLVVAATLSAGAFVATLPAQSDEMKAKMAQMKDKMKAKMEGKMEAKGEGDMMAHHSEIAQLADRVAQTFAAIQPNAAPAALKQQLDAHAAAIKTLQATIAEHGKMMEAEQAAPADPHADHH